jgi:tetratricopeptide (TPR) repeat protein
VDYTFGMPPLRALAVFAALMIAAAPAAAQGRVSGTVKDEDGRAIKGATITAENPDAAPSTSTSTSDAKGRFSMMGLRPGMWTFTADAPGHFAARTRTRVSFVGTNPALEFRLKPAPEAPRAPLDGIDAASVERRLDAAAAAESAGRLDEALSIYREVLARVPGLTTLHLQVGALLERKNDPAAALAEYQLLLKDDPDNAKARAAIERLRTRHLP